MPDDNPQNQNQMGGAPAVDQTGTPVPTGTPMGGTTPPPVDQTGTGAPAATTGEEPVVTPPKEPEVKPELGVEQPAAPVEPPVVGPQGTDVGGQNTPA